MSNCHNPNHDAQKVKRYLKEHRSRFVKELCEYVRFPSISADGRNSPGVTACAKWLVAHCRDIGLDVRLHSTHGNPIVVAQTPKRKGTQKSHCLVYGHYDVQPPAPLELWKSPPFEPRIRGTSLFGRGASDNKGQHFAHLKAAEAYLKTNSELPCDLTFIIEGEEEIGSPSLPDFLQRNAKKLKCDAVIISDTTLCDQRHPTLSYGLRGISGLEITLHGPSRDLHSGMFGGSIENPAMALCQLLSRLRDQHGRITIPGFYDDVLELSPFERMQFESQPFDAEDYKKALGVTELFGETGFTPVEQRSARPTLEINGLTSGYQGSGGKTIIPSWAKAKLTMRLVPNQLPEKIQKLVVSHLKSICPETVKMGVQLEHGGEPYLLSPENEKVQIALESLRSTFGHEPVLVREGGSIPIVNDFKHILNADSLLLGLALPDDNAHSPNEKFNLEVFAKGMLLSADLWQRLASAFKAKHRVE
jgi:acetylornithine deacetylase/succinyl-diaminopimelate desuccinylase-like protein